ncbi:hypothetical protein BGZ70_000782 [Mortierella alpina]|uniref:Uncharacterized protein n=1 Tax=Mortierella alpina TaxID=64518 RepID=A0A9P6JCI6_MORAP|nr:hypothetical protein BGZ70_000782 [Mortierella alpina]
MATETVIYVSLALVLLTRIYVFISPPDFLEEHKDRRYHEYHLYRQYHLHKQYDDDTQENTEDGFVASSRRSSTAQRQLDGHGGKTNPIDVLHHPSDELVLLGMGPGARPLPLHELSARAFSDLDPLSIVTPRSRSSSSSTARERMGQVAWGDADIGMPNFLSLDTSEIHYNGSLKKFEQDPEVREAVRELQIGQRDLAKECPTMTGQVRVQVLVDKDATMLAVTEEYWRAAGMTSDLKPLATTSTDSIAPTRVPPLSPPSHQGELPVLTPTSEQATGHQVNTSAATTSAPTVGLSLEETEEAPGIFDGAVGTETHSRIPFGLLATGKLGIGATLEQDDTDGDMETKDEVESDGYVEDDEGDADEEDDVEEDDDHHERKISIPEFMLPPPLHDEQVYLIVDPASSPISKNPPRRDSGHGDCP